MKPEYKPGDLVEIVRHGNFTLYRLSEGGMHYLRECPTKEFEVLPSLKYSHGNIFQNIEGKIGLIVYVIRNRLTQPTGYRVLIEGHEMFCKSKVGNKYFKLRGNQHDESGGSSQI